MGVVVGLVVILRKKRRWKFKQNEKFNKRETKEKSSNNIFLKDQRKCLCICFVNEKLSKRKLPNKDVVNYKGKALQTHCMFPFFFLKSSIPSYVCMVDKIWEKFLLSECNVMDKIQCYLNVNIDDNEKRKDWTLQSSEYRKVNDFEIWFGLCSVKMKQVIQVGNSKSLFQSH